MRAFISIFHAIFMTSCLLLWRLDSVSAGSGNQSSGGCQEATTNATSCLCYIVCQLSDDCSTVNCEENDDSCSMCQKMCLQNRHPWGMNITSTQSNVRNTQKVTLTLPNTADFIKIIKKSYFIEDLNSTCPADITISLKEQMCQKSSDRTTNTTVASIKCNGGNCEKHFEKENIEECGVFPKLCCSPRFVPKRYDLSTYDREKFSQSEKNMKRILKVQGRNGSVQMPCHSRFSFSSDLSTLETCQQISPITEYIIYGFAVLSLICIGVIVVLHLEFPQFRNTHAVYLLSLCAALFTYIATSRIQRLLKTTGNEILTGTLNSLKMYSWLSVYTWQVIMTFNLYQAFRKMTVNTITRTSKGKEVCIYSVIGWCIPLPLLIIGWSVQSLHKCFIDGGLVACLSTGWIFFFTVPTTLMVLLGLSLIIYTLVTVKKFQSGSITTTSKNGWMLSLVLRLQVLLGISWIALIVKALALAHSYNIYVIKVIEMIEALQGVFVLIAFVSTKNVRNTLGQHCGRVKRSDKGVYTSITRDLPKEESRGSPLSKTDEKLVTESKV